MKDLEEPSSDGIAADRTHITVVVADDTLQHHYNVKRTPIVDQKQKRRSKTHRKSSKTVDITLSTDSLASSTVCSVDPSQSVTSADVAQDNNSKHVQHKSMQYKNFPLLQLTNVNAVNQDNMKKEFPGLVKSLQIFDNAAQLNKSFMPQTQHCAPKMESNVVPPQNHAPPNFKVMPTSGKSTMPHDPSYKTQGHKNIPRFPNPFPLLNVTKNVPHSNHQSDFHFPLIPFKPFVPKLIKPNDMIGRNRKSKPFPLLHCEHPSYQQPKQGYPLLKLPVTGEKGSHMESGKTSQAMPFSKHHHDMSSQSSVDSMFDVKVDSVPSPTPSIKAKQRHRKSKKSKPSDKPNFIESSVQTDTSFRVPSPVKPSVEFSKDTKLAEKSVQASPLQSPMHKAATTPTPVLIDHQGLEMKRIEMRQSWKVTPTPISALQPITTLDNINDNDNNIHTSDTVTSTADSDTVNSGSSIEVTHTTRIMPDHNPSTVITNHNDKSSNQHTITVITDQDDKSLHKQVGAANDDQDDTSSHKQNFLNVMDIEGELVVNDDHKETTSNSDTTGMLHYCYEIMYIALFVY